VDSIGLPLLQAVRRLANRPLQTAVCVVVLALGMAAASSTFAVVSQVIDPPQPWPNPERLFVVHRVLPDQRSNPAFSGVWDRGAFSWGVWDDIQRLDVFAQLGAWNTAQHIVRSETPELADVLHASSNFFTALGITPVLGRVFGDNEDRQNADVVVLTHEAWLKYFGGREDVVGHRLVVATHAGDAGRTLQVIGVLRSGETFPGMKPDILLPLGHLAHAGGFPENRFLRLIGRLRTGVSASRAQHEVAGAVARAESAANATGRVESVSAYMTGSLAAPMWLLLGGSGLLLLLACSSVGSLLLVNAASRRGEFAIRRALGAARGDLLKLSLAEGILLSGASMLSGGLLALWFTRMLAVSAPEQIRAFGPMAVEPVVLGLTFGLGVLTVAAFGIAPALREIQRPGSHRHPPGTRRWIVVGQLAFALFLVSAAAIFGHGFATLRAMPLGFDPEGVALARIRLTDTHRPIPAPSRPASFTPPPAGGNRSAALARAAGGWMHTSALLQSVASIPGVQAVAASSNAPFSGTPSRVATFSEGEAPYRFGQEFQVRVVTEGYFDVLRVPLLAGRRFTSDDRHPSGDDAVIVSRTAKGRFSGEAIGARLFTVVGDFPQTVVGVVEENRQRTSGAAHLDFPIMYFLNLRADQVAFVLVRTSGDVRAALPLIRRTIESADPAVRVTMTAALGDVVDVSLADERFRAILSTVFAGVALTLAVAGLFGLTAERVREREVELAIRVALGAQPSSIRYLIFHDTRLTVLVGIAIGLFASLALWFWAASVLHDLPPLPVGLLVLAAVSMVAAAGAAVVGPAVRASRVDAVRLLRL